MVTIEQDILDAGAQIIWVLEKDASFRPGTAQRCRDTLDQLGSEVGWCVGDNQTEPEPNVFDNSPFAQGRGFDIIVVRETMQVVWTTNHGTTSGNENLSAEEVLTALQDAVARVRSGQP